MAVKSAFRALEILELHTKRGHPLTFSEIHEALGYPKASLHGLLRTMTEARWLDLDETARRYVLGVRVWEAGLAYAAMVPLESRARPLMERVRDLTTETVQLAVLDDFEVLYVAMAEGKHLLGLDSSVGMRLKPHATGVGKVLLASLPEESVAAWTRTGGLERYTPNTITEPSHLLAELRDVRARGYALDNEERTIGASCVAVGILNHAGSRVAAMSVSAPAVRFGRKQRAEALGHLLDAADELSAAFGYRGPPLANRRESEETHG